MTAHAPAVPRAALCKVPAWHHQRGLYVQAVLCMAGMHRSSRRFKHCVRKLSAVAAADRLGAQAEHAARLCCRSGLRLCL